MPYVSFQDLGRHASLPLRFWNMYSEPTPQGPSRDRRFPRPGLTTQYTVGTGPIRDTLTFQGHRVDVSGSEVYLDQVKIGDVPPVGFVRHAVSEDECVIVVNKRAFYVTLTTVAQITDPDLPQVSDVIFIAGRFIYTHFGTDGQFSWSAVNDARNIDGLAFASAESSPDPITGAIVSGDNFALVGQKTTEWWYPQDDINAPFIRSRGRRYDKGSPALRSIVQADNAVHFLGDDGIVYRSGAVPIRVSDADMENRIRLITDADKALITAYPIIWSGHTFYVLNLPGEGTWALDIGQKTWARWTTWERDRFRADCADGDYLGDLYTGRVMRFSSNSRVDMEDSIERIVACYVPVTGGVQRNTNLVLHCTRGVGLSTGYGSDPHVEMRYSDHEGADFTNWMEAPLGMVGDRSKAAMAHWVGLGSFQAPGRLYEFRCSDPVLFSPFMVSYNEQRP
jgi:hypothetical protein